MKQSEEDARNFMQETTREQNIEEPHISKCVVKLRGKVACSRVIDDRNILKTLNSWIRMNPCLHDKQVAVW